MRAVVASWGSGGDILPLLEIAAELRRRDHDVTLVANPVFESAARRADVAFVSAGTEQQYRDMTTDTALWQWPAFSTRLHEHWAHSVDSFHDVLSRTVNDGTVLVTHVLVGAAHILHQTARVRWVTVLLSPSVLGQVRDPSHPNRPLPRWAYPPGGLGRRLATSRLGERWQVLRHGGDGPGSSAPFLERINQLRARLGLPPTTAWGMSPRRVVGAWPEWFAPLGAGTPPQVVLTGFVMQAPQPPTPQEAAILDRVRALPARPVVFTTGTVASNEAAFYHTAAEVCRRQDLTGVLVTPTTDQLPASLPAGVIHIPGVPFRLLLPGARAIVHHGGIGTCAEALAAGVPQLSLPMAGDHFDNAERAVRLGVARMIARQPMSAPRLGRALHEVISSPLVAQRCEEWRARLERRTGVAETVTVIEQLGRGARGDGVASR